MFLLTPSSALNEVKICYGLKLNAILYALLYFTIDQNPFPIFTLPFSTHLALPHFFLLDLELHLPFLRELFLRCILQVF